MAADGAVVVRAFGKLRGLLDPGLAYPATVPVPREGASGAAIASTLGLPEGEIEAVFRNGLIVGLGEPLLPGDRIAFVPRGVPGPYRIFLGMLQHSAKRRAAG